MPTDIRKVRKDKGLSQPAAAEKIHINERTLGRIENGVNSPHPATREAFARAFRMSQSDLIFPADLPVAVPAFPLSIDPFVRRTLPENEPILVAERGWYALAWTRELLQEWPHRVATLRRGNYANARDFNLSDVEAFIAEHAQSLEPEVVVT